MKARRMEGFDFSLDRRSFVALAIGLPSSLRAEDPPNTHNMMIVGDSAAFLSHLPMFRPDAKTPELNSTKTEFTSPHRFQVILEARFTAKGKDVTSTYFEDRKRNPNTKMYTLQPAEFVLSQLFTPDVQKPQLQSFQATVFRGHLERPGRRTILDDITVQVKRVIHARQFDPRAGSSAALEYILFGNDAEQFVAHRIAKPPDFDQLLSVKIEERKPTQEQLSRGVRLVVPSRSDRAATRMREGEKLAAEVHLATTAVSTQIQCGREFYFEQGELDSPPTFRTTPEERKSGF